MGRLPAGDRLEAPRTPKHCPKHGRGRKAPRPGRGETDEPSAERSADRASRRTPPDPQDGYLVDPASSHMLVSKIKPCMSKYELLIL